jgi:hypothetical protein
MSKQSELFLTWKLRNKGVIFLPADVTSSKTIATTGVDKDGVGNDSVCKGLTVSSSDTVANLIILYLSDGSYIYPWEQITLPALTTGNVLVTVDCFSQVGNLLLGDTTGNPYLPMASGWSILMSLKNAISSGCQVTALTHGEDY